MSAELENRTDEELLTAHIEGDFDAFPKLMDRYKNDLLHFLIRFVGSRAAAEDVFQDSFLQIHISADTFDPSRRFKPWLFTIAANKGRDWHRKHSKRTVLSLSQDIGGDGEGTRFIDLMEADQELPDAKLLDIEQTNSIRNAVDQLPSHLREILLLSYFQQMSYVQIADSLQIPLGTVKSRLHAAVAAFSQSWHSIISEDDS
ncbi:MAG: RNA polymerase sigma factor [Phycisphaerae bacterium]|jgi:RNA polymerase sigma-70 factor, ECF subfamily|nr:RNA polymerase sigma factor [Phycisphaerae bacterium]MBT5365600.1 RNA polymerase sigma factor [Phycisphaerae bacterium]MBT6269885.1 RNA polymerase sigma factor [Phycisphaerae bacterium]